MLILSIPFLDIDFVRQHSTNREYFWKEYRLDYNRNWQDFPLDILDENSILTIRDKSEGGLVDIPDPEKIEFYKKAINKSNCLVDLEIKKYKIGLINPENLILSYHDFSEHMNLINLDEVTQKTQNIAARFVKLAVNVADYSQLLSIEKQINLIAKPVIFAGMGILGKISRLLHKHLGATGTFVGLQNKPTASGQIYEYDVDLYNLRTHTATTKIGGIIGGKQVEHSLGLQFYNEFFLKNNLEAAYFPFAVQNIEDFKFWLENCSFRDRIYGFSVTMPFKSSFQNKPINLFIPNRALYSNTDQEALQRIVKTNFLMPDDRILIFGTGAMAAIFLSLLQEFSQVSVSGRNEHSGNELAKIYSSKFLNINEVKKCTFDVLVNCTPLGMNGEDFIVETGIRTFKKVIDLPYHHSDTKLIRFCKQNKLPFIDGKQFWQWQSAKQLAEFVREI
jgi:3-dehydroquinate dehydratase/shikimate dehydrogenase